MAELNFTENEGKYVAEVKVTADFNLHIELILPPYTSAYKDSPFEREAYANQRNPNYLATRPLFAWWRYMLKDR